VAIAGHLALVLVDGCRLNLFDVSVPASPQWISQVALPYGDTVYSDVTSLTIRGDLAYVADGAAGIQVVDFTDPWNPLLAGQADVDFAAMDIRISGAHLYVTDLWYGPWASTTWTIPSSRAWPARPHSRTAVPRSPSTATRSTSRA
jgi:hypothetical protein